MSCWSASSIMADGSEHLLKEQHHAGLVNCNDLRAFWLRLTSGNQWQLGQGYPEFVNPIFTFDDPDVTPVHGVGFCSYDREGEKHTHEWEYSQDEGECLSKHHYKYEF